MRRLVILLTIFFYYFCPQSIDAQDALNRWSISLGTNAVNNPVRELFDPGDEGRFANWNQDAAAFKLTTGYYIGKGFSFLASGSVNNITEIRPDTGEEFPYISIDGEFKFNFTKTTAFDPYVKLGGGYTWFDDLGAGTFNGGGGFNIWVNTNFGFFIESVYKLTLEDQGLEHWQHSAGVIFKFGIKDRDKDGIKDQDDECPEEFGLLAFNGCPDTDGDGVKDSEDQCPNTPGLKELNGCPDADGDGVSDPLDACPDVPGLVNLRGCPDKDGDGIPDNFDNCPDQPGPANNRGCPLLDSDGDGVPDANDRCPSQAGPADNNGCPLLYRKIILFEYSKEQITDENKQILNEVAMFIKSQKNKIFHIAGHTDNTFTEDHNLELSKRRAEVVKEYLVSQGVNEAILTTKGYGETIPLNPNDTESEEARKLNRRVEILEIKF